MPTITQIIAVAQLNAIIKQGKLINDAGVYHTVDPDNIPERLKRMGLRPPNRLNPKVEARRFRRTLDGKFGNSKHRDMLSL